MIKLMNYDKIKEELQKSRTNLRFVDFDEILSSVCNNMLDHLSNLDKKGAIYVFYRGGFSFWFELCEIAKVLVGKFNYCKEYRFNLTHVCRSDEALLVL